MTNHRNSKFMTGAQETGDRGMTNHRKSKFMTGAQKAGDTGMNNRQSPSRSPQAITESSFNIGRFALPDAEQRLAALHDYFDALAHKHAAKLEGAMLMHSSDHLSMGELYCRLQTMLRNRPVSFPSDIPGEMARHWDRLVWKWVGYCRKNGARTQRRHERLPCKLHRLRAYEPQVDPSSCDPDDSEGGSDAAARDLLEVLERVTPRLSSVERFRIGVLLRCMPHSQSQRFVARRAGCSKQTMANLLRKVGKFAPAEYQARWGGHRSER